MEGRWNENTRFGRDRLLLRGWSRRCRWPPVMPALPERVFASTATAASELGGSVPAGAVAGGVLQAALLRAALLRAVLLQSALLQSALRSS